MTRCKFCGQSGLQWDDNWSGNVILREPDTELPHNCVGGYKVSFTTSRKPIQDDDNWICGKHGKKLIMLNCPIAGCKTDSMVRKWVFVELQKRMNVE